MSERLQSQVEKVKGGCWLWTGLLDRDGYGEMRVDGRRRLVHRLAYEEFVGEIPVGLTVDHECHNMAAHAGECSGGRACPHRRCWRPGHLVARSAGANAKASPLTAASGRRGGLSDIQKDQVVALYGTGPTQEKLASMFGCSQGFISKVVRTHRVTPEIVIERVDDPVMT